MPNLSPRELVILAKDYDALVKWYVEVLNFKLIKSFSDGYRYARDVRNPPRGL